MGSIKLPSGHFKIWARVAGNLQFSTGPGPKAKSIKMDKFNRRWIKWYEPLNELFDLVGMPLDDPIRHDGRSTDAQRLNYLTNVDSRWDYRPSGY
jgi:hypothetical protein